MALTREESTPVAGDIQRIHLTLAVRSTERVVDIELKTNLAKNATQVPMNMVVGDEPMTGILMGKVMGNRPVTAEGITNNKAMIMTHTAVAANTSPTNLPLRAMVPSDERTKGMVGAGRVRKKFAPPMAQVQDRKHTAVGIPRAVVVDTKKARVMVSSNALMTPTTVPGGVTVKSHTVVLSHMDLGAMMVKGMDASTNEGTTTTTRPVDRNMIIRKDAPGVIMTTRMEDKSMVVRRDTPGVTTTMTAVATIVKIRITPPRPAKPRKLDTVRVPSARRVMSRVVTVAVRTTLATVGTKPMVQNVSIFVKMMKTRAIMAERSTITNAGTRTIEFEQKEGTFLFTQTTNLE